LDTQLRSPSNPNFEPEFGCRTLLLLKGAGFHDRRHESMFAAGCRTLRF
jgi:hypothetical protein